MLRLGNLSLPLDYTPEDLTRLVLRRLKLPEARLNAVTLVKQSVDARDKGDVHFVLTVDAQVKGESISITAQNGNVGTAEAPLLVDTNPDENGNPGVLSAAANNGNVFITEISGAVSYTHLTLPTITRV